MGSGSTIFDLGDDILITQIPRYLMPEDIFNFSLVNKATYDAFYHSSLSTSVYKILYNKKFTNNDNNFTIDKTDNSNWIELFKLRVGLEQKVYTWGCAEFGRLGYKTKDLDPGYLTDSGFFSKNVHTPNNVVEFNGHLIVDIIANGRSFLILTNAGDIFYTGVTWKNLNQRPSTPGPVDGDDATTNALQSLTSTADEVPQSRRSIRRGPGFVALPITVTPGNRYDRDVQPGPPQSRRRLPPNPNLTRPPEELNLPDLTPSTQTITEPPAAHSTEHSSSQIKETNLLTKLHLPKIPKLPGRKRKIISLSSGREHIVALDNLNSIYSWDSGTRGNEGVIINFPGIDLANSSIVKVSAGWNLSAAYVYEVGLIVWYSRVRLTQTQYDEGDKVSDAKYFVVPQSKYDIADFAVGYDYILFIRRSTGKLYKCGFSANEYASKTEPISANEISTSIQSMDNFNDWLSEFNIAQGKFAKFNQVSCRFTNFVVITDEEDIVIGNQVHLEHTNRSDPDDDGARPKWIPELQNQNIKRVEIGDHHYLGLTSDGKVLSWGLEISNCGSLGLGNKYSFLESHDSSEVKDMGRGDGMRVLKPFPIRNPPYPGKWVCITANGWHSGGIYVPT